MEDFTPQLPDPNKISPRSAAALRELEQRAQSALAANREHVSRLEAEITSQLEQITETLREQIVAESREAEDADRVRTEIDQLRAELEYARTDWAVERSALETERDELTKQLAQLEAELRTANDDSQRRLTEFEQSYAEQKSAWDAERLTLEAARDDLSRRVTELETEQHATNDDRQRRLNETEQRFSEEKVAWDTERAALESKRDELIRQVTKLEAEQRATKDEWQRQLTEFERKLGEQQTVWNEQRSSWSKEREGIERERDELQQKFELALEDVQRYRGRVAELEQELDRRPEANQADSAELVALRAERDALSERVEQLERQPATQIDANSEQQFADLQRRFELAVEDVRELKTKNAKLESKLASAGKRSASPADSGDMDWESQKRRLLASLDDSGEHHDDPLPQKERISIESTIEMTDAVVAEKDSEIAELKARLAAGGDAAIADAERDRKINELVDADTVITQHRKRFAELENEMQDKLRAHELELSLERAKMARQKTELEDLRAELEAQSNALGAADVGGTPGAPRRRWLSKLGLSGDEQ